jgi:hypothetical protein
MARDSGFSLFVGEETAGVLKAEYLLMFPRRWFNKKLQMTCKGIFELCIISKLITSSLLKFAPPFRARELHVVMECSTLKICCYTPRADESFRITSQVRSFACHAGNRCCMGHCFVFLSRSYPLLLSFISMAYRRLKIGRKLDSLGIVCLQGYQGDLW